MRIAMMPMTTRSSTSVKPKRRRDLNIGHLLIVWPSQMLTEEVERFIPTPPMPALKKIKFQPIAGAGGLIDPFDFAVAAHRRLDLEALVVRADLDEQRLWSDQPMKVRHVAQLVEAGRNLAAAEV